MVDHLAEHFQSRHGVDLRGDRESLQRLKDAAERAKCELSFTDRTTVLVPRITATENLELGVTRLQLESLVEDLVEQTLQITRDAVADAGLKVSDIEDVILVGGQTRMPRVREAIGALFGREPSRSVHPEEVVAIGAAVHAHTLVDPDESQPLLLDVTPFDLGIEVAGGLFQPIITKNSNVPASSSRTFATAHDNQDNVQVTVRQGSSRFSAENEFLGRFVMGGLTPAPRMTTKVEVTFRLDNNGMLHVSAMEPATGERKRITIRNYAEVAQAEGGVEALIEGDTQAAPLAGSGASVPGAGHEEEAPSSGSGGQGTTKSGLFARIFGRKPAKPGPASTQEPAPAPAPASADAAPPAESRAESEPEPLELGGESLEALAEDALEPMPADAELAPLSAGDLVALDTDALGALDDDDPYGAPTEEAPLPARAPDGDPFGSGGEAAPPMLAEDPFGSGGEAAPPMLAEDPFGSGGEAAPPMLADDPYAVDPNEPTEPEPDVPDLGQAGEDALAEALAAASAAPVEAAPRPVKKRRKPAKLKLAYPRASSMVEEYRENLERGGCFIRTEKPLKEGRECRIEVRAPGLETPMVLEGTVSWSSAGRSSLEPGQQAGMEIAYHLDEVTRELLAATLDSLD